MKRIQLLLTTFLLPLLAFAQEAKGLDEKIDEYFGLATGWFVNLIFYQITFTDEIKVFWVLFPLILGALYFTVIFKVPGIRLFMTAINTVRGKYEHVEEMPSDLNIVDGDEPDTIRIEGTHGKSSRPSCRGRAGPLKRTAARGKHLEPL